MGSNTSRYNDKDLQSLHAELVDKLVQLMGEYKFWTRNDICNKLEVFYYDKLSKFNKSDLLGASAAIGYKMDSNVDKDMLCHKISKHYGQRLNLLIYIWQTIMRGKHRLNRAKTGGVCCGTNLFIETVKECDQFSSMWIPKEQYQNMVQTMRKHGYSSAYDEQMFNLRREHNIALKRLERVVQILIDDIDNNIDELEFRKLSRYTESIIENYNYWSDRYYTLMLKYLAMGNI